jgi:cytosine/uracil/thiamine/allantoin permease
VSPAAIIYDRRVSNKNSTSGSYPFSNDVTGLWPKYINIFRATCFISIFCIISTPWNIIRNAGGLLAFLSGYSCLMGPLAGIMVMDYYIIKGRKLNIHAMYQDGPEGIYWYTGGFNIRAFIAFFIGVAPLMPGFAKSIEPSLDVGDAWKIYAFAWLFGFTISSLTYYVICKYIWPQTVSVIDEAVYPPQKGEVSPSGEILGVATPDEETKSAEKIGIKDEST